jgi:hypothetical protein
MGTTTKITRSNAIMGEGVLCGGADGLVTHVDTREFKQRSHFSCGNGGDPVRDLVTLGDFTIATATGEAVQSAPTYLSLSPMSPSDMRMLQFGMPERATSP